MYFIVYIPQKNANGGYYNPNITKSQTRIKNASYKVESLQFQLEDANLNV